MALTESRMFSPEGGSCTEEHLDANPTNIENVFPLRPAEGFLFEDQVEPQELFQPSPGRLSFDRPVRHFGAFDLYIGKYASERYWRRVGLYLPTDVEPGSPKPLIVKTAPWLTGNMGHGMIRAGKMANDGAAVFSLGQPRYYELRGKAATLTEDANEIMGAVKELEKRDIGNISELLGYGESQAAMKILGSGAVASMYDLEFGDVLSVAPCFIEEIDWSQPVDNILGGIRMMGGAISYARKASIRELWEQRRTLAVKDIHHHVIVPPVLTSGETGTFLPHIPKGQRGLVMLFGKDTFSKPYDSATKIEELTDLRTRVWAQYGHVDGIKSLEVDVQVQRMIRESAKRHS